MFRIKIPLAVKIAASVLLLLFVLSKVDASSAPPALALLKLGV